MYLHERVDRMLRDLTTLSLLLGLFAGDALARQDGRKKLPQEDVVDVPAIGPGLSVSNVFQSRMVLQRDKPAAVWGWADAGEEVNGRTGLQKRIYFQTAPHDD